MTLPDTPNVSLRDAIIWIAYGNAKSPEDLADNLLWLSREKDIADARESLWLALGTGRLEASAIGPDWAPTIIGKHEWQFLFGSAPAHRQHEDSLYVKKSHSARAQGAWMVLRTPRFTDVTVPRNSILSIWPPRLETNSARVGRPSIMNQIESELDRWTAGGFQLLSLQMKEHGQGGKKTITAIAHALDDWSIKKWTEGFC